MAGLNRACKRRPNAVALNGDPVLCLDAGSRISYPGTGTAWTDLSGNANNGTLTNGPTFDSANGGSLVFDGVNDYAIFTSNKSTSTMTISCWANPDIVDGNWRKILIFPYGATSWVAPYYSYQLVTYQNNFGVGFNVNSTYTIGHLADTSFTPTAGVWYNLVGTFNSGIISIYVNGTFKATKDVTASGTSIVYTSRTQALIGTDAEYSIAESFKGKVSNVNVYNRALSATEIATNFELLRWRYGV